MKTIETEVLIIGSGVAGATLAAALCHHPFFKNSDYPGIHLIDRGPKIPAPPETAPAHDANDSQNIPDYEIRISSINRGSENVLRATGAWDYLKPERVFPYRYVEIADQKDAGQTILQFDAHSNDLATMGVMVENSHVVYALQQQIAASPAQCQMHFNTSVLSAEYDSNRKKWHVSTDQGQFICQLLVAADGKNSFIRQAAGIDASKGYYQQKCIVGNIAVDGDLRNTAWQRFLPTGPLGVLPLGSSQSMNGEPANQYFSLAWSCDESVADAHMKTWATSEHAFIEALQKELPAHYGNITSATKITAYPLWHQQATHYTLPGLALIGDAAHSIHPLAGLGANLGIRDAAVLAEELFRVYSAEHKEFSHELSDLACQRYSKRCKDYNHLLLNMMGMFKSLFSQQNNLLPVNFLSSLIRFGNRLDFVKKQMIEYATGLDKNAPDLESLIQPKPVSQANSAEAVRPSGQTL